MGDSVMTTPSIKKIFDTYQNPQVIFIGSKVSLDIFRSSPGDNQFIELKKNWYELLKISRKYKHIDLFLSYRSSWRSSLLKLLIQSSVKFQFQRNQYNNIHQVAKYFCFTTNALGLQDRNPGKLILYPKKNSKKNNSIVIGINPGAAYGSAKRWTLEGFMGLVRMLSGQNYKLILFGSKKEIDLSNQIEDYLKKIGYENYENLCGKTTIHDLKAQISVLNLFITGDSGPMHIAAAYEVPSICIFGPTKYKETSQWENSNSKILRTKLDCQPCMERVCPLGHHKCMKDISFLEVYSEAMKLVKKIIDSET